MWKLLFFFLTGKKNSFARFIKVRGKIYLLTVGEYIPIDERLKEWECALKAEIN